jgi:hypothetical protein
MKLKAILGVAGLVIAAFGLGMWLGLQIRPVAVDKVTSSVAVLSTRPPGATVTGSVSPCADIHHVDPLMGKNGCVTGLVLRVYSARTGNTFLDFCQDYRACPFTSVIFAADKSKFGDLESLQGKRVEIRGDVVTYQGRAEIIIRDPQQVRSAP